ncbi:hypothetical protein VIGAN_11155300, partial [Vigna angularis var. angularis]
VLVPNLCFPFSPSGFCLSFFFLSLSLSRLSGGIVRVGFGGVRAVRWHCREEGGPLTLGCVPRRREEVAPVT